MIDPDLTWLYRHRRRLWGCAVLCFIPPLFFYYVGEEANYTLMSMEMWQHRLFRSVVVLGDVGGRPPLYNWLMIPVARLMGWSHVLLAARLVTFVATLGTAGTLGWLVRTVTHDRRAAALVPLLYLLSADVLLYRGWLAYADPLFSFWVVLSVALLWVSCQRRDSWLLLLSLLAIFACYLTKVITAYIFFAGAWGVLTLHRPYRNWLISWRAGVLYGAGVIPLIIWWYLVVRHDPIQASSQSQDIASKIFGITRWSSYLLKLVSFPMTIGLGLLPSSWILLRSVINRWGANKSQWPQAVRLSLGIAFVNFIPYWLAPQSANRYVMPLYGFVVMAAALLWTSGHAGQMKGRRWVLGFLLLGGVINGIAFPLYQSQARGRNYQEMAHYLDQHYYGLTPIYITDHSSVGLSVVAILDSEHFDRPALTSPPPDFKDGLVVAYTPGDVSGKVLTPLRAGPEKIELICRGKACDLGQDFSRRIEP